jgi:hypothetical protein
VEWSTSVYDILCTNVCLIADRQEVHRLHRETRFRRWSSGGPGTGWRR